MSLCLILFLAVSAAIVKCDENDGVTRKARNYPYNPYQYPPPPPQPYPQFPQYPHSQGGGYPYMGSYPYHGQPTHRFQTNQNHYGYEGQQMNHHYYPDYGTVNMRQGSYPYQYPMRYPSRQMPQQPYPYLGADIIDGDDPKLRSWPYPYLPPGYQIQPIPPMPTVKKINYPTIEVTKQETNTKQVQPLISPPVTSTVTSKPFVATITRVLGPSGRTDPIVNVLYDGSEGQSAIEADARMDDSQEDSDQDDDSNDILGNDEDDDPPEVNSWWKF